MCDLTNPAFTDEDKAREVIEATRWPNGAACSHCGLTETVSKLGGKSMGPGWYHCRQCREKFTVRTGTLYERSHIPLHKWLLATHLLTSSKKGMSAHQLFRMLGFGSYRTAWFMAMRIREGMRSGDLAPMGGGGGIVEADETFIGRKEGSIKRRGHGHKNAVLSLVERGGQVRSFHVDGTSASDVMPIIRKNVAKETAMMTDEGGHYSRLGSDFASHETVQHKADEYVRYEGKHIISTNTGAMAETG